MTGRGLPTGPRPKRGGEDFARSQRGTGPQHKKARFDTRNPSVLAPAADSDDNELDDEEDAYLEADGLTRRGAAPKRNAVNIDGYDSDSSNEGFDARAAVKAKTEASKEAAAKADDDEDDDMFADGTDDDDKDKAEAAAAKAGKKRKDVRFADLDRVDDLEESAASKSGGHVSADLRKPPPSDDSSDGSHDSTSDESEADDAVRAAVDRGGDDAVELGAGSKKKHAPKLDAFNLQQERNEGAFDESLNFVRAVADPDARLDNWMDGVSRRDMKRAQAAQQARDKEERRRRRALDEALPADLLVTLVARLQRGETPLEALQRLAPARKKGATKRVTNKKKAQAGMEVDEAAPEKSEEELARERAVDAITEAAGALLDKGEADIYSTDREMLRRMYKRETGEDLPEPARDEAPDKEKAWEFRWADARDGGETHGPYDAATMAAWRDAGYFGEGVLFRAGGGDWSAELAI